MIDFRAELIAKAIRITDEAVRRGEEFSWYSPSMCLMGHYRAFMSENVMGYGYPYMTQDSDLQFLSMECGRAMRGQDGYFGPVLASDDWTGVRSRLMEKWGILVV